MHHLPASPLHLTSPRTCSPRLPTHPCPTSVFLHLPDLPRRPLTTQASAHCISSWRPFRASAPRAIPQDAPSQQHACPQKMPPCPFCSTFRLHCKSRPLLPSATVILVTTSSSSNLRARPFGAGPSLWWGCYRACSSIPGLCPRDDRCTQPIYDNQTHLQTLARVPGEQDHPQWEPLL